MSVQDISTMADEALALIEKGQLPEALQLYENITTADPENTDAWTRLCRLHVMLGRYEQAEPCCRKAAALLPESLDAQANLANTLQQQHKFAEAAEIYQQLVELQPDSAVFSYALGSICTTLGQVDAAAAAFHKTLALNPNHADAHYGLGFNAYTRHNYQEATEYFQQVVRLNPGNAQAHNSLGTTLQALGQYPPALEHYDAAIKIVPMFADAHFGRANVLIVLGETEQATQSLRETLRLNAKHAGAHISLASVLMTRGKHDEALASCERALEIDPQYADAVALAATIEQHAGKAEQAMARLQPWIDRGIDSVNMAVAFAEVSKTLDRPADGIDLMEQLLSQGQALPMTSQRNLRFNLGRLYDKTGQYDRAFEHYRLGNQTRPLEYNPTAHAREIDTIITVHSPVYLQTAPRASTSSSKPVFIVGMPRSGTSLVEQILASHPQVHGAGELPDMWQMVMQLPQMLGSRERYPHCMTLLGQQQVDALSRQYLEHLDALAPDADRVVDKMPGNFSFLGLIELLFPEAHVIHCMRDPLDTCLSCYFQDFSRTHAYSYDLAHLGAYYNDYLRMMAHWRTVLKIPIMDISYEDLIADQEAVSRKLVEFCDLEWDDSWLNFHETERFVATASYDQVRRPLYKKSVARWKHYEKHIGALVDALKE